MSIQELIQQSTQYSQWLIAYFAMLPIFALALGFMHRDGKGSDAPWKYVYSVLIYLSAFPGMCAVALIGYQLFFLKGNLLDVNAAVYFLPVVSMVVTLALIARNVTLIDIPGFDRLSGLLIAMLFSVVLAIVIMKTRILVVFYGSVFWFFMMIIFIFVVIKVALWFAFRKKKED